LVLGGGVGWVVFGGGGVFKKSLPAEGQKGKVTGGVSWRFAKCYWWRRTRKNYLVIVRKGLFT